MHGRKLSFLAARVLLVLCPLVFLAGANALAGFDEGMNAYIKGDYAAARSEWLPLADAGNPAAQYAVAQLYQKGVGAPRNYALAAKWYQKAADAGYGYAMYGLGFLSENGQGTARDRGKAIKLYEQAAQRQVPEAQLRLGYLLSKGLEARDNFTKAYYWSSIAAANPYAPAALQKEALALRNTLEGRMTRGQLAAAQAASQEFKPLEYKISP